MTTFEYIMIYIMGWWVVLFILLPIGSQPQTEEGVGYHAAPKRTYLPYKLLGATVLAFPLTIMVSWLIESGILMP